MGTSWVSLIKPLENNLVEDTSMSKHSIANCIAVGGKPAGATVTWKFRNTNQDISSGFDNNFLNITLSKGSEKILFLQKLQQP